MAISIIVPCFNKAELTGKCLLLNLNHCLQKHQWIFIDNNSDEATQMMLLNFKKQAEALGHNVIIHRESENTGVAKAWNRGMTMANGEYYCILNNDCVLQPAWDGALIEAGTKTGLNLYSPMVLEPGQLSYELTLDKFLVDKLWQKFQLKNLNKVAESHFSGIVLFGKAVVFNKIGTFDERLWLSMEDIDYQYRAKKLGFRIGITGSVLAFHFVSATRSSVNYSEKDNQSVFTEKWGWSYVQIENTFWNKRRRTLRKFLLKKMGLLSQWPEQYPLLP